MMWQNIAPVEGSGIKPSDRVQGDSGELTSTVYDLLFSRDFLQKMLQMLVDMLQNLVFRPKWPAYTRGVQLKIHSSTPTRF